MSAVSLAHNGPSPAHPSGPPGPPGVQDSGTPIQEGAAEKPPTAARSTVCFNPVVVSPYLNTGYKEATTKG